ncbi:ead/Ea22-like family protein [Salmonella enterica]|uniref:ead/Ea22-like family protein n=1 Tax=Salmonella enterica TaxID=28901 RepID=UPI0010BECEA1|nr:ead/Ea22-like family protein [Salmonella enterica]ECD5462180.1 ead/Ea22-like family protein [Salmonella enterica subsp. enterica serovar Oranienburg]ECU8063399.1 ead/Ea22-like family protein [Salmonella enterica subsp. enterica serovar O rough]EAU8428224.1 ead/Ea22-like family protein [Salmonella enterica]EAV5488462.1 ead/Ea22-like family protein [Salmonella enterica]EBC5794394.1 ead/Ea22-like family protein [Salmonella enterica]
MSNIDKQALRERYSPKPVPKCHICGEEMTIQRMSASRITYGCTGATYDDKGCHYAEGRSIADDHYEQSRITVVDVSDPDVLALLDELEAETGYREGAFIACNRWHDKFRETEDKLECAERRIAELEAKLETADKLQDGAFRDGLKAGFSYGQTDDQSGFAQCMSAYSTRAGIGVKQQEDSVDSDVSSRNQPGMVVAVHIDAGDFVKFKGQVFEVEETDFDDHDVTLWFVGGNTLKCAAGCQVEVVSAPVAAGIKVKG